VSSSGGWMAEAATMTCFRPASFPGQEGAVGGELPGLRIHTVLELRHGARERDAKGVMVVAGVLDGREGVEELTGDGGGGVCGGGVGS
jgi:hypothetical protein